MAANPFVFVSTLLLGSLLLLRLLGARRVVVHSRAVRRAIWIAAGLFLLASWIFVIGHQGG